MLLKLRYDGPLSNFAFNFNLRRYNEGDTPNYAGLRADFNMVGRCRLT
jgi:hypothetical protein